MGADMLNTGVNEMYNPGSMAYQRDNTSILGKLMRPGQTAAGLLGYMSGINPVPSMPTGGGGRPTNMRLDPETGKMTGDYEMDAPPAVRWQLERQKALEQQLEDLKEQRSATNARYGLSGDYGGGGGGSGNYTDMERYWF